MRHQQQRHQPIGHVGTPAVLAALLIVTLAAGVARAAAAAPTHDGPFAISLGDTVSNGVPAVGAGRIEGLCGTDEYTFDAAAGTRVSFTWVTALPFGTFDAPSVSLKTADGTVVDNFAFGGPSVSRTGIYYPHWVSDALPSSGQYSLTVGYQPLGGPQGSCAEGFDIGYSFTLESSTTTEPGAPTDGSGVVADGGWTASWSPPVDDGGEPLLRYGVYGTDGFYCDDNPFKVYNEGPDTLSESCLAEDPWVTVYAFNPAGGGPALRIRRPVELACGPTAVTTPFPDVASGTPFCGDVDWFVWRLITTGYPDGTYRPAGTVLRQEMAAFLYRFANHGTIPTACTSAPFSDIAASNPFCGYVTWLVGEGITTGAGDGSYGAADVVTRGQMAAFMYRLANPGAPAPTCTVAPFPDVAAANPFCGYIDWLASTGVTTGYPDGSFRPNGTVQRDVMAAFLHRLDDHLQSAD